MRRRSLLRSLMGGLFSGRMLPASWQAKPEASLDLPAITAKLTSKDGWTPDVDELSSISPDIRVIVTHNALVDMDLATTLKLTEDVNKGLTAAESSVFNSREVTVVFSDTPKFIGKSYIIEENNITPQEAGASNAKPVPADCIDEVLLNGRAKQSETPTTVTFGCITIPQFTKTGPELRMICGGMAAEPTPSAVIESCEDCKHAIIFEDDPEGRPPFCECRKGFEIKTLGIMKWKPVVSCNAFEAGEGSV